MFEWQNGYEEKKLWIKIFHPSLQIHVFNAIGLQLQESTSCDFRIGSIKANLDSLIAEHINDYNQNTGAMESWTWTKK